MKKAFVLLFMTILMGCNTKRQFPLMTDGLQTGLEFQNACMNGDFEKAAFYMLKEDKNTQLLKEAEGKYVSFSKEQKKQLREASLQNLTIENITTEEIIIHYNNSFNKESGKLKVVQKENIWLVDFKYKFDPNL